jgi:hypothetical protein
MLARTPFTEIEIDGVGTYRLPNQWQSQRLRRLRGEERHTAVLAIGCGRTVRQFNKLPADKQYEVHKAYLALSRSSPSAAGSYATKRAAAWSFRPMAGQATRSVAVHGFAVHAAGHRRATGCAGSFGGVGLVLGGKARGQVANRGPIAPSKILLPWRLERTRAGATNAGLPLYMESGTGFAVAATLFSSRWVRRGRNGYPIWPK